jgi:X-X-X-Leu-X-X-Gly heptad repeat protein
VVLTEEQKRQIGAQIKQGLHRKLWAQERTARAAERMKFIYKALAGISAAAACLVIGVTIFAIDAATQRRDRENRIAKLDREINYLKDFGRENDTDRAIQNLADGITALQEGSPTLSSSQSKDMADLLDALSKVPEQPARATPPGQL